ncbi:hypothetical protein GCM10027430_25830 [Lysobacter tyrosinilyticus]
MGTVTALGGNAAAASDPLLDGLISQRRIWRGQSAATAPALEQPTGWPSLDALLPTRGWPAAALSELLLSADGVGELQLLWPTLSRLSQPKDGVIALIAPPYHPYPPAWQAAGVRLGALQVIRTKTPRDALWAAEQCLRSGACDAVLCWPLQADDRALRRLQVAAETGQALGFAFRPMKAALNPSPAALRIAVDASPRQLRVLKCRGGNPPVRAIPFPTQGHPESLLPLPALQCDAPVSIRAPLISKPSALPSIRPPRPAGISPLLPLELAQSAPDRAGIGA